jgi:hypothetical protein
MSKHSVQVWIARRKWTRRWLAEHREVFDRITADGCGGRVDWHRRMPRAYDNKRGLPWSEVRGRYWYPWREQK